MPDAYTEETVDITRLLFECPQIEQAHQQWLQALDAIPDPILLHDNEGRILRVNQAYAEKAGASSYGELIGAPYWYHFPPQEAPLPECQAIAEGAASRSGEIHLPSGEAYRVFAYAVRDPKTEQRYGFHIFRDITEEVRNRQQRREHEAFFAAVAETARDAVIVMDPEGKVAYWNRMAEEILGYSSEEAMGKSLHPLIAAPRHRGEYEAGLRHFTETGEGPVVGDTLELEARHKDGTVFPVELSVSAVQLEGGWHALGILRDITQHKVRERRLERTTEYLRALIQAHSALVDAAEEATLFQDVSRALAESRGYPLVWVGMAREGAGHPVEIVGSAGSRTDYLDEIVVTWGNESTGQGPTGRAIREGGTRMARNIATDPSFSPWREPAEERGIASSIALPLQVDGETIGALNVYATEPEAFDDEERSLLEGLAEDLSRGLKALRTQKERNEAQQALQEALVDTVEAIARLVDRRDPYTAGHQKRVAELGRAIGRKLGLPQDRLKGLYLAGLIHDLGKISIPAELLSHPGKLSNKEFDLIKDHAREGYEIIQDVAFPWPVAEAVLQHHERLDGSGYPDGLRGDDILFEARILGVADVVEAVCSHRPYRPALGIEAALEVIQEGRGIQFTPAIVDACLALFREEDFDWEDTEAGS